MLALALAAFAPGLVGYGLSANLSRVLYARRRNRAPALAIAGGWLLVIVADAAIVPFVPAARVVPVLGLGTTFGLTVSGIALLVLVRRECGPAALRGVPRAFLAGLAGCAAARWPARPCRRSSPARCPRCQPAGFLLNVGLSVLVAVVVTAVFAAVVLCLDGGDVRGALSRLRARPSHDPRLTCSGPPPPSPRSSRSPSPSGLSRRRPRRAPTWHGAAGPAVCP